LQSGFDGDELLLRPNTEVVTVGPEVIAQALSQIAGCQRCRGDDAQLLFDSILADVLGVRGAVEFVTSDGARCPIAERSCRSNRLWGLLRRKTAAFHKQKPQQTDRQ